MPTNRILCSQAEASNSATIQSPSQTFELLQPLQSLQSLQPLELLELIKLPQSPTLQPSTASQSQMATSFCMPLCNEHTAPTFDSSKPHKLPQFFEDLETLMMHANITNQAEMKKQVLKYVDVNTKQMWKTFQNTS